MYFILFIRIYFSSTTVRRSSYQPSLFKQSDETMRGYMTKENKISENVPFSYSNCPVQRAEFQSSQRRTKKNRNRWVLSQGTKERQLLMGLWNRTS